MDFSDHLKINQKVLSTKSVPTGVLPPHWPRPEVKWPTYEKKYVGYTNSTILQSNIRLNFNSTDAAQCGLSSGVYVCDYIEITHIVPSIYNGGYVGFEHPSPNCGYKPAVSGIGYASIWNDSTREFKMVTRLYHVKTDMLGRTKNVYAPRGLSPGKLEWNVFWVIRKDVYN